MTSRLIGLEKLRRKIKRLGPETRKELRKALAESAAEIVALQRSLAPKVQSIERLSAPSSFGEPPSTRATGAFRPKRETYVALADDIRLTIYAGDDEAFYARWIEFGTAPHEIGGLYAGTMHPGTPAQPYFFPGYRALRKRARSRIARAINKAAKRVATS